MRGVARDSPAKSLIASSDFLAHQQRVERGLGPQDSVLPVPYEGVINYTIGSEGVIVSQSREHAQNVVANNIGRAGV